MRRCCGQHLCPDDQAQCAVPGIGCKHPAQSGNRVLQTPAKPLLINHLWKNDNELIGTVLTQKAAAAQNQRQARSKLISHLIRSVACELCLQPPSLEDCHRAISACPVSKQCFRHPLNRIAVKQSAHCVAPGVTAYHPSQAAAGIQQNHVAKEIDMPGYRLLCQIENMPDPADMSASVGPPIFRA